MAAPYFCKQTKKDKIIQSASIEICHSSPRLFPRSEMSIQSNRPCPALRRGGFHPTDLLQALLPSVNHSRLSILEEKKKKKEWIVVLPADTTAGRPIVVQARLSLRCASRGYANKRRLSLSQRKASSRFTADRVSYCCRASGGGMESELNRVFDVCATAIRRGSYWRGVWWRPPFGSCFGYFIALVVVSRRNCFRWWHWRHRWRCLQLSRDPFRGRGGLLSLLSSP